MLRFIRKSKKCGNILPKNVLRYMNSYSAIKHEIITHDLIESTLHIACIHGHLPVVEYIIGDLKNADYIESTIELTAKYGHVSILRYLLSIKICKNNLLIRFVHTSCVNGYLPMLIYLIESLDNRMNIATIQLCTLMRKAIINNNFEVFNYLSIVETIIMLISLLSYTDIHKWKHLSRYQHLVTDGLNYQIIFNSALRRSVRADKIKMIKTNVNILPKCLVGDICKYY